MFIKLTKLDGTPIWINAVYVVTVEPRKGGGSVVVPVGDGLDYDVRESPEKVLAILGDVPAPPVIPIPSSDALTKTPADVSPEPESNRQLVAEARQEASAQRPEPKPAAGGIESPVGMAGTLVAPEAGAATEAVTGTELANGSAAAEVADGHEPEAAEEKPRKRARKTTTAKKPRAPRKAKKPALPIPEAQVERLRKMAPGSVKKLQNTLQTQFKVEDAEGAVAALEANGVVKLDRDHVIWD